MKYKKKTPGSALMLLDGEIVEFPCEDVLAYAQSLKRITAWNDMIGHRIVALLDDLIVFDDAFVEFHSLGYLATDTDQKYGRSNEIRRRNLLGQTVEFISYGWRADAALKMTTGQHLYIASDEDYGGWVGIVVRETKSGTEVVHPEPGPGMTC